MSLKSYFEVVDAPLAIVLGGVAAVLITLQLGALGLLVQSQVDRANEREAGARQERMAHARCLGVSGAEAFAACRQSVPAARAYESVGETVAIR
jgi:hypothetical protein